MSAMPLSVDDIKQWAYCPRIAYFHYVMPVARKPTYKMRHGKAEEARVMALEERRTLAKYGAKGATRYFHLRLASPTLGLTGIADLVLETPDAVFVVDYKHTEGPAGSNLLLQGAAYSLMAGEQFKKRAEVFFIYRIPADSIDEYEVTPILKEQVYQAVDAIGRMIQNERMPAAAETAGKCVECEYQNYCGDVF